MTIARSSYTIHQSGASKAGASKESSLLYLEPISNRNQTEGRWQACTAARWNCWYEIPASVGVLKETGSHLFWEPFEIHFEATNLLVKGSRQLFLVFRPKEF